MGLEPHPPQPGGRARAEDAPRLHRYLYAHNRPTFFIDPDGREVKLSGYTLDEKGQWIPTATDETTVIANPTIEQIEGQLQKGEIDQAQALAQATGTRLNALLGPPKRAFEKSYERNLAEETIFNIGETVTSPAHATLEGLVRQDPTQIGAGLAEQALVGVAGVALRAGVSALVARFPILSKPVSQLVREGRTKVVVEPVAELAPQSLPRVAGGSEAAGAAVLGAPAASRAAAASDDAFAGVRELSRTLQQAGLSRAQRLDVISSFREGTIAGKTATGEGTFLRYFGGQARAEGRYLTPSFPVSGSARTVLALPPENYANGIAQFRLAPGTRYFQGTVAPNFGKPGGGVQIYVLDKSALVPVR